MWGQAKGWGGVGKKPKGPYPHLQVSKKVISHGKRNGSVQGKKRKRKKGVNVTYITEVTPTVKSTMRSTSKRNVTKSCGVPNGIRTFIIKGRPSGSESTMAGTGTTQLNRRLLFHIEGANVLADPRIQNNTGVAIPDTRNLIPATAPIFSPQAPALYSNGRITGSFLSGKTFIPESEHNQTKIPCNTQWLSLTFKPSWKKVK